MTVFSWAAAARARVRRARSAAENFMSFFDFGQLGFGQPEGRVDGQGLDFGGGEKKARHDDLKAGANRRPHTISSCLYEWRASTVWLKVSS